MGTPPRTTADRVDLSETVEYDAETDTYRATFDGRTESVSTTVISLVATVTESDPMELEPLYSVVDPDALDALMTPDMATPPDGDTQVTFTFEGHEVTVHSYGLMRITPDEPPEA